MTPTDTPDELATLPPPPDPVPTPDPTPTPVAPTELRYQLVVSGQYAGDETELAEAVRDFIAGYGVLDAVFTTSWGEDIDVSNPQA